jgi:hypothetical protein
MSGGGGTQQAVTKTEPFDQQIPFLLDVFNQAQARYNEGPMQFFPGSTLAPISPFQTQGIEQVAGAAGPTQEFANAVMQANTFGLTDVLDIEKNPAFAQGIDAITTNLNRSLTETALPSIASSDIMSGNFDVANTRGGIAEGQAVGRTQDAIGAATAGFTADAFGNALNTFNQSLAAAPQTAQLQALPGSFLDIAGTRERQLQQDFINAERERHEFEQMAPDAALAQYASLVSGNFGGTTTSTTPGAQTNPFMSGLGMASMATALIPGLNPFMALGFGLLGGFL